MSRRNYVSLTGVAVLALAGLVIFARPAVSGKVYMWTDEAGVRHITDTPPPEQKSGVKELTANPAPAREAAPAPAVSAVPGGASGSVWGGGPGAAGILPGLLSGQNPGGGAGNPPSGSAGAAGDAAKGLVPVSVADDLVRSALQSAQEQARDGNLPGMTAPGDVMPGSPATGTEAPARAPSTADEARLNELRTRLDALEKEKAAYDLQERRARSKGDGYAKQRARYHQSDVEQRIGEVQEQMRSLTPASE